jgi:outer membrane receptor protein involved in Fe transport
MFIWKMRNVGRVHMYGTDLSMNVRWKMNEWGAIYFRGNYSYQYAVDMTDPSSKNWKHQIPYAPCHTGSAVLSMDTKWMTATYTLNAVGDRYAMAQNIPANLINGYLDHGLSLNHTIMLRQIRLHLSLEALNLTDDNYEVIRYYPMPGRNYRLTIKISY